MPSYSEDPHAPSVPGKFFHPEQHKWLYWCNCAKFCCGRMKTVGRTTWFNHNPKVSRPPRTRFTEAGASRAVGEGSGGGGEHQEQDRDEDEDEGEGEGVMGENQRGQQHPSPEPDLAFQQDEPMQLDEDLPAQSQDDQLHNGFGLGIGNAPPAAAEQQPQAANPQGQGPLRGVAAGEGAGAGPASHDLGEDDAADVATANLEHLKRSLDFIQDLRAARITDDMFPKELQKSVLEPAEKVFDFNDADVKFSLDAYIVISNASENVYRQFRKLIQTRFGDKCKMLSLEQIKKKTQELSRVIPIISDMCINSCIAFTSRFKDATVCPECGEARFRVKNKKNVSRRKLYTMPIGPTIQGLWRNPVTALEMCHRREKTLENLNKYVTQDGTIFVTEVDDYTSGEDYLRCILNGIINLDDCVLMLSMDGAQLYRQKNSDCWIVIWILMDLPPHLRYKKDYIIPAVVIPGPNAPKIIETFLFPSLAHVAACQQSGLKVWDPTPETGARIFVSRPVVAFGTADSPAMVEFNGFVGHKGKECCREFCNCPGRRMCIQSKRYYPALLKPDGDYNIPGSSHPDIDPLNLLHNHSIPGNTQAQYDARLQLVLAAKTETQYQKTRRDTGVAKPSIMTGMHIFPPMPAMFPSDGMHLFGANHPQLWMDLFRGLIDCQAGDNRATWDFAIYMDGLGTAVWERHGKIIALWRPFFAKEFGHVPPNPVEYVNSGYRTQEFLIYIYDLLPALLYGVLPETYWTTFCKLCAAVKIVLQRKLTRDEIVHATGLMVDFAVEFEVKFVQRKASRIHFVRPCVHNAIHIPPSTLRVGPHGNLSQYPIERTIGNIVQEIKQHTTPSANTSQRAIRRAQVNTMKALTRTAAAPRDEFPPSSRFPRLPAGAGYTIAWPRERSTTGRALSEGEFEALDAYFGRENVDFPFIRSEIPIRKWGRLQLPSGEVARSRWLEDRRGADGPMRISRMVEFKYNGQVRFGEVLFYFASRFTEDGPVHHLAMISTTSLIDHHLHAKSSGALRACDFTSGSDLVVVRVTDIRIVVSVLPFPSVEGPELFMEGRWFIIEDFGRELSRLTDSTSALYDEPPEEEDDEEGDL